MNKTLLSDAVAGIYEQIQENGYVLYTGAGGGQWNTIGIHISEDGTTSSMQITEANMYSVQFRFIPVKKGMYVKRYDNHTTSVYFCPLVQPDNDIHCIRY